MTDVIASCCGIGLFSLLCDSTRDSNNIENFSIILRYIKNGKCKEHLLDAIELRQLDANYATDQIINRLREVSLQLEAILSQCYDGASVMSG